MILPDLYAVATKLEYILRKIHILSKPLLPKSIHMDVACFGGHVVGNTGLLLFTA